MAPAAGSLDKAGESAVPPPLAPAATPGDLRIPNSKSRAADYSAAQPPLTVPATPGDLRVLNLEELQAPARRVLPKMVYDYYASAADDQATLGDNRAAFRRLRVLPRVMVNVSSVDMSCHLFGQTLALPVLVAPMAMQRMAHPDGELAVARACADVGTVMVVSTMGTCSLEEIASATRNHDQLSRAASNASTSAAPASAAAQSLPAPASSLGSSHNGAASMARGDSGRSAAGRHQPHGSAGGSSAAAPAPWFQLYVLKDRAISEELIRYAEAAGYAALVVTVDAQRLGKREADERNAFRLPAGLALSNLEGLARVRARLAVHAPPDAPGSGIANVFTDQVDTSLTWEFLAWLKRTTRLPILVKGVLSPADARIAVDAGADGIVVSNHGGRQLDGCPAAIDALPGVVQAVGGRVPVLVDGGVRRGTDVLKALALGARAVLLGRPVLWALALGGRPGVLRALGLLRDELELAMALAGCPTLSHIGADLIMPPAKL